MQGSSDTFYLSVSTLGFNEEDQMWASFLNYPIKNFDCPRVPKPTVISAYAFHCSWQGWNLVIAISNVLLYFPELDFKCLGLELSLTPISENSI